MLSFILRRVAALALTLCVTAAVIFIVLEILPGDPAAVMMGVNATPENVAAIRAEYGLDRPAVERFLTWIGGLLTGDLGLSYTYRVPISSLIAERAQVTLPLAAMAVMLSASIGIPLGTLAAAKANTRTDSLVMGISQLGLAVPNFWFGILLVLLFAVTLGWFPAGGFPGWGAGVLAGIKTLILPAVALALPQSAILARLTRSAVLEALQEDFVRTARAKGLSWPATLRKHVLRNALVPVVTILGLQFSVLVAGAIIIENVFSLPGLGRLMFQSIAQHDIIVVKDLVVLFAALVVFMNFIVDVAYGIIDPRLRRT
ncbi:MAG TPA: ABC transporter permease [Beijerinckiaceae bacterium]|mgnify:CR=1 FL=1|nr:ABC transporter permease [Beijerinckiaceae bacterium]